MAPLNAPSGVTARACNWRPAADHLTEHECRTKPSRDAETIIWPRFLLLRHRYFANHCRLYVVAPERLTHALIDPSLAKNMCSIRVNRRLWWDTSKSYWSHRIKSSEGRYTHIQEHVRVSPGIQNWFIMNFGSQRIHEGNASNPQRYSLTTNQFLRYAIVYTTTFNTN